MTRSRRRFLRFLAASPLLPRAFGQKAADILSVMDFEPLAHDKLPPAHWGYMASGVDDNLTRDANNAAYKHIELRPHRLVDVSKPDLRITLFGVEWPSPIFLCPLGGQKMFHPEGEVAVARAARSRNALQILSTQTSASLEDVAKALGRPPWYQLYMPAKWEDTEKLVRRVEAAGCPGDGLDHRSFWGGRIRRLRLAWRVVGSTIATTCLSTAWPLLTSRADGRQRHRKGSLTSSQRLGVGGEHDGEVARGMNRD